jgi:hypothetical protein
MKILILGHGQHGKDSLAEVLHQHFGLTFRSSSEAAFQQAIWPVIGHEYDGDKDRCYEDRRIRRDEWRRLIAEYNTPDKARLARTILEDNDIYVGMRCPLEYAAARPLFDLVIWVERIGMPAEPSMNIPYDSETMALIVNAGTSPEHAKKLMTEQAYKLLNGHKVAA